MPPYDEELERLLTETFRRLVLDALVKAERLSEEFREKLLMWGHGGGFSVYGRHLILNEEPARLAHMARYAVRPPADRRAAPIEGSPGALSRSAFSGSEVRQYWSLLPRQSRGGRRSVSADRVCETEDGRILLEIPPDPKTGATVLSLDPLEWIRRMTNQIPDPKMHMTRFYGAYANRARRIYRGEESGGPPRIVETERLPKSRATWARLLRMVFEVDPLACPRCGARMKIVSVITAPTVVDKILRHLRETGKDDLFAARAPPAA